LIVLAAVLAGILLIMCVGGGIYVANRSSNSGGGGANPDGTNSGGQTTVAPGANNLVAIDCNGLKGRQKDEVERVLKDKNLDVKTTEVDTGGQRGEVVSISPCQVAPGGTVTITVRSGKGGGGPGPGGDNCTPGIGGLFRSCAPTRP
jgi:hypothetical protein